MTFGHVSSQSVQQRIEDMLEAADGPLLQSVLTSELSQFVETWEASRMYERAVKAGDRCRVDECDEVPLGQRLVVQKRIRAARTGGRIIRAGDKDGDILWRLTTPEERELALNRCRIRKRANYNKDRDRINKVQRELRARTREKVNLQGRKQYAANRERINARKRALREEKGKSEK